MNRILMAPVIICGSRGPALSTASTITSKVVKNDLREAVEQWGRIAVMRDFREMVKEMQDAALV
jgi:hypothetical protein